DVIGYDFVSTAGPDQCASNQGEDCTNPDNDPADFNGHGTAVAGCVAAITNNGAGVVGVAGGYRNGTPFGGVPGVKVMCLRVGWHGRDGNGYVRMDFAAEAINYAVQKKLDGHNIAALNCSWGTSNSGGIDAAVNLALANDIMVIHAAGNGGNNSPDYMGNKAGVMNVGATDSTDTRTSFSDFGSWVDCAAPGEDIISTYHAFDDPINDYVVLISGTSFSSPSACGVAALLESYDPSLSATDKFTIMVTSGDDIGNQNVGLRLNARNALDSANPCVDVSAPSTTLLTPNGGDSIAAGTFADITWNATDDCGIADVEIRLDRGDDGVYEELIALLPGNPGTYSWSVTGPATATARIQVAATDGLAQTGSDQSDQTFTITQNQAPVLAPLSPQVVAEADTLSFPVSASDPDLDSITLFAFSLPTNATFADNGDGTGTVEFSPDFSQAGDYTIIFVASDGALSDTDSTTVTVTNTNRPPVFDPAGPQSVDEGQMLIVPLSASDPDSDALTLAAVSLPPNALLSDNGDGTGAIDFQPDFSQAGSVNLIIRVTDGTDADTLSIPTTVHNVNRSPVASPVDSQFVDEGQVLILPVGGTDVDGDSLVLDLVPLPTNAVFVDHGDGTGELTFSPDYDQAGEYPLQMFVTDLDLSDTVAFNIRVADALPPCACDCHSDPVCDSVINVLDVVQLIEVAFRGGTDVLDPSPTCPFVTTDLNCDGQTNVLDAVIIVDVAFRGGDPNASICDPCL
ncbi:MAG TPA: S8 family serine peptidase, partial [candidate division Zixibacteria bacterium]|nr:S8 family serine peptidase [candidate division Zixibacteria bacterium]